MASERRGGGLPAPLPAVDAPRVGAHADQAKLCLVFVHPDEDLVTQQEDSPFLDARRDGSSLSSGVDRQGSE